jgi:hypothetical protein
MSVAIIMVTFAVVISLGMLPERGNDADGLVGLNQGVLCVAASGCC